MTSAQLCEAKITDNTTFTVSNMSDCTGKCRGTTTPLIPRHKNCPNDSVPFWDDINDECVDTCLWPLEADKSGSCRKWVSVAIFIAIGGVPVLIVIAVVTVCVKKKRNKKAEKDSTEMTDMVRQINTTQIKVLSCLHVSNNLSCSQCDSEDFA